MADLMQRLTAEARRFDFFQALLLLEEYFAAQGVRDPIHSGRVRMEADASLAFPPSDIAAVDAQPHAVRMLLFFMGLIGVSSPLPIYFSEHIARHEEQTTALRDFMAIFNHRMYALFYYAWKKYVPVRALLADASDRLGSALASLAGIPASDRSPARMRILAYCSLMMGRNRSAAGLETLLSDFFDSIAVKVKPWQPRWAPMRDAPPLGETCRLGVNAVAGDSKLDFAGKFRICIGPLPRTVYETFLPGTANIAMVRKLVDAYCADPLLYDIEVMLQSEELIPVVLGAASAPLGLTSALGRTEGSTGVHSVIAN